MRNVIDNKIDLTATCEAAGWHRLTAIEALTAQGIERRDAEAFVDFEINEHCILAGGAYDTVYSGEYLSDEQDDRIAQVS